MLHYTKGLQKIVAPTEDFYRRNFRLLLTCINVTVINKTRSESF